MDRQGKHQESAIWLKQMIHPSGAPAQTEFLVERRFVRSIVTPSPLASRVPLSGQGEHEGEGQGKVHGKKSPYGEEKFAVIRAIPRTGRTHQIRVHLSAIGHPIVGDKIYGPDEQLYLRFVDAGWTPEMERRLLLPRHALHSARLAIEGEREWASPLPPDLAEFCSGDRRSPASNCNLTNEL
jgi:23S rRNA pseudouridine1911/1915/1917 synthase